MATGLNRWFFLWLVPFHFFTLEKWKGEAWLHPLHISVTEINHNSTDKTLEISCKMFTDDFEKVLAQNYKTKVDLINPVDRLAMEKLVNDFIQKHIAIKADGKSAQLSYLGYERENDAIYSYFQADNIGSAKKLEIINSILHELFTDQINMMHIVVGGKRKSVKLDFPEKEAVVSF
ncbi:MAG TPA: DUF6702 family protein [Chitinophagaceae bacterium]|nr:DUF6702 family protein [Chitinophagaceae bacterium]